MKIYVIERKHEYPTLGESGWQFEDAYTSKNDAIGCCQVAQRNTKDKLRVREYVASVVVSIPTKAAREGCEVCGDPNHDAGAH